MTVHKNKHLTTMLGNELKRAFYSFNKDVAWNILAQKIGCTYTSAENKTEFVYWGPNFLNSKTGPELIIWEKTAELTYQKHILPFEQLEEPDSNLPFGIYFLVINNLKITEPGSFLYEVSVDQKIYPDIFAQYFPFGTDGPAEIIDNQKFTWTDQKFITDYNEDPISILKLHVGISSQKGTFEGLFEEIDKRKVIQKYDAIEFLPIGEFPGKTNYQIHRTDKHLTIKITGDQPPINWGYDGGPSYLSSISHAYGNPNDLKTLINKLHSEKVKIGFDIQINHFGPEDVYNEIWGPWISASNTAWGPRPNFRHLVVRKLLIAQIRRLTEIYHVDFLRLDMSSRYDDDLLIKDIKDISPCIEITVKQEPFALQRHLPIILEDERDWHNWLFDVANASAQWGFALTHAMQAYDKNNAKNIKDILAMQEHAAQFVVFSDSHDEMGNNSGRPMLHDFLNGLMMISRGIPMHWLSGDFFHFFTNYKSHILQANVVSEKCGIFKTMEEKHWKKMPQLHKWFKNLDDAKKYFAALHQAWGTKVAVNRGDTWPIAIKNITKWFSSAKFPNLKDIIYDYSKAIFTLSNINSFPIRQIDENFFLDLRKMRQKNPWLYASKHKGDYYKYDEVIKSVICRRINPLNVNNQLYFFASKESILVVTLCVLPGKWKVAATTYAPYKNLIYTTNDKGFITLALKKDTVLVLERIEEKKSKNIPLVHLFKGFLNIDKQPKDELSLHSLIHNHNWWSQYDNAGMFNYDGQEIFFGFQKHFFILFSTQPIIFVDEIYFVDNYFNHFAINKKIYPAKKTYSKYVYTLELIPPTIQSVTQIKLVLKRNRTVMIYVPR